MSRMSEINQDLKDINNWFKNHVCYIVAIVFVLVMAICIYGQANKNIMKAREKENRINTIEMRLEQQMNYIHELVPTVYNLYEVINL